MVRLVRLLLVSAAVLSFQASAAAQDQWVVTLLSQETDFPYSVNDSGLAVGVGVAQSGGVLHGMAWQNGMRTDLGTLPGAGLLSRAYGVNRAGVIVGMSEMPASPVVAQRAVRWLANGNGGWGAAQDLGTLGGTFASAMGIDDSGRIVGEAQLENLFLSHAFLWQNGTMIDLGTLGGNYSTALAISDSGQYITGYSYTAADQIVAFKWTSGTNMVLLPSPQGYSQCSASAVNNSGQAVGNCAIPLPRAVTWTPAGVPTLLEPPSALATEAYDINQRGEIAGSISMLGPPTTAVVWYPATSPAGVTANLFASLPTLGGSTASARSLNNTGVVVGNSAVTDDTGFAAAVWSAPFQDLAVDFGATFGTWKLGALNVWQSIHALSPDALREADLVASGAMVAGDLDGNGLDDLAIDFGVQYGVWVWMNHATWSQLHGLSPTKILTADLDGNGQDEVILDFPGFGLWRFNNNTTWQQLHNLSATRLASGNLDGTGGEELLINFPGLGLWRFHDSTGWTQLHTFDIGRIVTADLDGNSLDEVVVEFATYGLWVYRNNATWTLLHTFGATQLAGGDMDGNGLDELVIDFGPGLGLYVFRNNASWASLHNLSSEFLAVADLDGGGRGDLVLDFGPAVGLWLYRNNATWQMLHSFSPEAIALGRLH